MQCVNCGSYLSSSDGTTVEGVLIHDSWYCEDCYVKEFRQCKCGNLFDIKHGGVFSRQQWFCNNCFINISFSFNISYLELSDKDFF